METILPEILEQTGIGALPALIVLLCCNIRMNAIEKSFAKHIEHHKDTEEILYGKFDKIYERLNPLSDSVNRILGYIEARNDKNK